MVWSYLHSFGGSHKLPRKFYVNRRPLFGKSGAGTVETTLPFGNAYPLPHYLLFIWCLLERWYCSDLRLVCGWEACSLQDGRQGGDGSR